MKKNYITPEINVIQLEALCSEGFGQCWILITNTSTWKGHGFSNDSMAFFEKMRKKYMDSMPKQDLFLHVK